MATTDTKDEAAPKSKKKLIGFLVPILVGVLASGYWFFFLNGSDKPVEPIPGEVVALEPIQVNLSGGHYLKIGIALQMEEGATGGHGGGGVDGSAALDATIKLFSGRGMEELARPADREKLRTELVKSLHEPYHGLLTVYFTEFVTQ